MSEIGIGMLRPHMRDVPVHSLPDGFVYRPFRAGDADLWLRIQADANRGISTLSPDTFRNSFAGREEYLPDRSWFVVAPNGDDVASITAWWLDFDSVRRGLIHWVAVVPDYQGRGIGKAMMTHATLRLAEEFRAAYLNTSCQRIPAIKVYLDFGFLPDMDKERADEGWAEVRANLRHSALGNT